jgi:two-component system OmpR family sensor kinase
MTERINSQVKKLEQFDSMRRELVANVSHDLRTPLATLRGYIETLILKDKSLSPEERQEYLKIAINHCERLGKLIADLFELAKLDAHDMALNTEPFSLSDLVQDVIQKFELTAKERKINMVTNIGRELPFAYADIAMIERVLENLIDNALRFTPEQGRVGIELSSEGKDTITVKISDTGKGIPETELPRIFDRFYRTDSSRKDRSSHSGLGLAVTKKILELHGSPISVKSNPDEGTVFTFNLPVYKNN